MAAVSSSSPWGNKPSVASVGSWALDSEQNEAEQQRENQPKQQNDGPADFPSLSAAVTTKPKKKKGQTLSLAEFSTYTAPSKSTTFQPSFQAKGLTHEDFLSLPTGPRQRTAEELERSKLGGGFRSYGGRGEDSNSNSRWGSGSNSRASSDDTRRDSSNEFMPSRADEVDNWAAGKKSTVGNGFERRERGAGAGGGAGGGFSDTQSSKADESDNWGSNKSFAPTEPRRYGGVGGGSGGGFERERRGSGGGGFDSIGGGAADSETWGKKKGEEISSPNNGSGSGSGRPKLNLQPRTLPVVVYDLQQPQAPGIIPKAKGSNPFGEARPREEVLAEKGQDWKKIDERLESTKIKEVASSGIAANGSGNRRGSSPEDLVDRSWRKTDSDDVPPPQSTENVENEVEEEN